MALTTLVCLTARVSEDEDGCEPGDVSCGVEKGRMIVRPSNALWRGGGRSSYTCEVNQIYCYCY